MKPLVTLATRYPQKRVLITGATAGLGEALALQFAAAGFRVAVASRNPEKVAATCSRVVQAGGEPLAVILEVTRVEDFDEAAQQVEDAWGGLDILINNAGVVSGGKIADISLEAWQHALNTDMWSVIHGCRILLPLLDKSGGGHLVNVASAAGLLSPPDLATYNVAKAAVVSLSETLRVELADKKIDVTVSCPTVFKSSLFDKAGHEGDILEGETIEGLRHDMDSTSITSDDIAASLVRAMARRRLYDLPQRDARLHWWLARTFPETFRKIILYMYRHKLWVFNTEK